MLNPTTKLSAQFLGVSTIIILPLFLTSCSASGNHGTSQPRPATASNTSVSASPEIRDVLSNSCFDCHSNDEPASWDVRLAPSYLFRVDKARQTLNFSAWQNDA